MAEAKSGQIVNVMKEERLFPPPKEFAAKARIGSMEQYEKLWKEAAADLEGFLGQDGQRAPLVQALHQGSGVERAVCQVVRRRPDQRLLQLPRRPSEHAPAEQGRLHLGRRAGRRPRATPTRCCTTKCASSPTC